MTHIVEHKSFRYTWELLRHTYIVDLESEIDILQVEISPARESRLLDPPYQRTSFFEIEIDQIQKNGRTVSSFRNICPVEIRQKPGWNFLKSFLGGSSSRVTRRFQSQDGETETRWLYTDDLFLISLSSGDRHDLSMLLSLIIQKLNMIALSIQSGRRIRSEFENQQKYRAAMSDMFSEGVDGAFRDVPVYKQHGDMTSSDIDVSAALMSVELQDLMAECSAEKPGSTESVPAGISRVVAPDEEVPAECTAEKPVSTESVPAGISRVLAPDEEVPAESADAGPAPAEPIGEVSDPFANIVIKSTFTEAVFGGHAATAECAVTEPASIADTSVEGIPAESIPEENAPTEDIPAPASCSSCGTKISGTTKFCGTCGAAVSTASPAESGPAAIISCCSCGAGISGTKKFCGSCGAAVSTASPAESGPAAIISCGGCGAGISGTKKFCGSCGAAVSTAYPAESAPVSSGITAHGSNETAHSRSRSAGEPVVNLKSIEELDDLSWLTD